MGDVAPLLNTVGDGVLKKTFPGKEILAARGVLVGRGDPCAQVALVIAARGHHARVGIIETAEAVSIALSGRSGDYVINRGDYVIDGIDVSGAGRGGGGRRRRLRGLRSGQSECGEQKGGDEMFVHAQYCTWLGR